MCNHITGLDREIEAIGGVIIDFRLDGNLFDLRATTKVTPGPIFGTNTRGSVKFLVCSCNCPLEKFKFCQHTKA